MRIILFGAGAMSEKIVDYISKTSEHIIVAIADNKWKDIDDFSENSERSEYSGKGIKGHIAISPKEICKYEFDRIIITLDDCVPGNDKNILQIYNQLKMMGIPDNKLVLQNYKYIVEGNLSYLSRMNFIKGFADYIYAKGISGAVSECGVLRGHISAWMNSVFFDRKIYLFDTFDFWDERDLMKESEEVKTHLNNVKLQVQQGTRVLTNENMTILRCPNRKMVTIKKGYVPDSFEGIEDQFVFVNLDMDIFAPQLAALHFFAPKMVAGGVILLHDYFHPVHTGTKRAIEEFGKEYDFSLIPIGDSCSIALLMK